MRLDPRMTADDIEAALDRAAAEAFGQERATALEAKLRRLAGWLERIAATPLALDADAPDQSGIDGEVPA